MDLIRLILLHMEAKGEDPEQEAQLEREIEHNWASEQITYNAALLIEQGFAKGAVLRGPDGAVSRAALIHLHYPGHELARIMERNSVWERIKTEAANRGAALTLDFVITCGRVVVQRLAGGDG